MSRRLRGTTVCSPAAGPDVPHHLQSFSMTQPSRLAIGVTDGEAEGGSTGFRKE